MLKKHWIILVGSVIVVVASVGVGLKNGWAQLDMQPEKSNSVTDSRSQQNSEAVYLTDYSDNKILVGYAQNVFAGKIIREVSSEPRNDLPHFQYDVEIIYNIKGNLEGQVTVDYESIPSPKTARLEVGSTYVMAARHIDELGPWFFVGSHNAFLELITRNTDGVLSAVKNNARVRELLNAYPNEVLRDRDIEKSRTQNSFVSLSDEEKAIVFSKIEELSGTE